MTDLQLTYPERSWLRREGPNLLVLAVLLALVLVLAVMLSNRIEPADSRPRAAVGEVVIGPSYDEVGIKTTQIMLPWARMDAFVSEPLQELPRFSEERRAQLRPPTGGSFIQVSVEPGQGWQIPLLTTAIPFVGTAEAVLTADGRDYPLTTASLNLNADTSQYNFGGTVWVAVDGQPTDISLAITVDGDTQVLADGEVSGGRAAELAAIPSFDKILRRPEVKCGPPLSTATDGLKMGGQGSSRCYRQFAIRTPYVDGLGWADEGRDFLVVHLATYLGALRMTDDTGMWWPRRNDRVIVTLDGQPSLGDVEVNSLAQGPFTLTDPDNPRHYVFDVPSDVPAGELEITYTFDAFPSNPRVGDSRQVELRWRVPAGDPAGGAR